MSATAEDRLALVTCDAESAHARASSAGRSAERLPWLVAVAVRPRPRLPAVSVPQLALSAAVALVSAWLLVQGALLQDAAQLAAAAGYARAVQLAAVSGALLLPAAAAARCAGARLPRPGRLCAAAALTAAGALMVQAGRRRGALPCNAQDPLLAVVAVFALVAHLLTSPKLHMRPTVAQVVICLGAFVGVSYQACNKYRCRGNDHSVGLRASAGGDVDDAEQSLWLASGTAGMALLCGAALLLERSGHRKPASASKRYTPSWWDSLLTAALLAQMALVFILLLFWTDLIPAFGESASLSETWASVERAFRALSGSAAYLRSVLACGAALSALGVLSVRLLHAGRPVFLLSALLCLGVLLAQIWWSLFRVDGAGGWVYRPRVTGEAVTALLGVVLELGGLAVWWRFENRRRDRSKLAVMEFDVYSAQSRSLVNSAPC